MEKVRIYSTPTCPFCHRAKAFLKEAGIDFEDFDVSGNQKALAEMMEVSGQMGVPVIVIGDQIVTGFDRPKIEQLLGLGKKDSSSVKS